MADFFGKMAVVMGILIGGLLFESGGWDSVVWGSVGITVGSAVVAIVDSLWRSRRG